MAWPADLDFIAPDWHWLYMLQEFRAGQGFLLLQATVLYK